MARVKGLRYRDVLCAAMFLAYAWAGMDTRLIYYGQGPVFSTIPGFLDDFLKRPGGPGDYLYALIAQSYESRFWGAVVLTAQVVCAAALIDLYLRRLVGRPVPLVRFVPAVVVLLQPDLYYKPSLLKPGILAALAMAALLASLAKRQRGLAWRIGPLVLALPAAYWVGGLAAIAVLAPAAAALFLWRPPKQNAAHKLAPGNRRFRSAPPAWAQNALLLLCLGGVAACGYWMNSAGRRLATVYLHGYREDWAAVLESARGLRGPDFNPLVQYQINLALHETNRLGDDMFRYPQPAPMLLAFRVDSGFLPYMLALTDMCLRLGRVNEAEEFASDILVGAELDPRLNRTMVRCSLAKNDREVARKLLTVLSYDLSSGTWARRQLRTLAGDPEAPGDPDIQRFRRRMNRKDDMLPVWQRAGGPVPDTARMLLDQLDEDPSNRMAFEFLMGSYLLARDRPAIEALMPRIKDMSGPAYATPDGARRTPRYYQEAMAMLADATGRAVEIDGCEIQPETFQRLSAFKSIVRQFPSKERARQEASNFRDSYFFYVAFGPGDNR